MNIHFYRIIPCLMLLLVFATPAMSESEWELLNTLKLESKPIDLLVSADKRWVYILTDGGKILIYTADGQFKDAIKVDREINRIKAGGSNDSVYLLSSKTANIQKVRISVVEDIDTQKAPFMGLAKAPVSVVVFSDFQ